MAICCRIHSSEPMPYTLPALPYSFDALEPFIDEATMRVHHDKHHQTYCDNVNKFLAGTGFEDKPIEEVLRNLDKLPEDKRTPVRNHGGGFFNHSLFWTFMSPAGGGKPSGDLEKGIVDVFGSLEGFQEKFTAAAMGQFGSGWAWLVSDQRSPSFAPAGASEGRAVSGQLEIMTTLNQDSPVSVGKIPLLTLDVWEHAYYLKYQNRRADYVKAWWNVVNWEEVARRFEESSR